ncbi:hypothetical protein [Pseudomonas alabamensis]|jgi:hypothetical protein|uniref:hypothetical protein n=1 Tax=Pseudomonas alabamensis TaxID=3064349 RepID=UPI003F653424
MLGVSEFGAFMARYFAVFLLGFFAVVVSSALTLALFFNTHWKGHPHYAEFSMVVVFVVGALITVGHVAIVRGWRWGSWFLLAVLASHILMALSLADGDWSITWLGAVLMLQMTALLVFNSQRYREMRSKLIELRVERAGGQKVTPRLVTLKRRGRR